MPDRAGDVLGVEVFHPSHRESALAPALVRALKERGAASRPVPLGGSRAEMLHVVRKTQPDTAVVVVEYALGDYRLVDLLLAILRWRAQRRRVVLWEPPAGELTARRRLALGAIRSLVHARVMSVDPRAVADSILGRGPARAAVAMTPGLDALVPLLACPDCRGPLARAGAILRCGACAREYEIVDGIPVLLPRDVRIQVEEHEEAYVPGDAYRLGAPENRGWLEIGLYKRDLIGRLVRGRRPRASLDVGCGDWGIHYDVTGALGRELSVAGDVSLGFVRQARSQATSPARVHHLVFSAEALPFRPGVFDFVYCSEVLEHLETPERALAEMRRVAPGGRFLLTVPNERIAGRLEEGHVQTFGHESFSELVSRFGEIRSTRGVFLYLERDPNRLARSALGRLRLGAYLRAGERLPGRSLLLLADGRFGAADAS